jgi:methylenetetrahydrofolate dehydrogenase (NADP+) / methenyltetrahydrofolate cyclohydrolase
MIINGKQIAAQLLGSLKQEVSLLGFTPIFCDVLVGTDPVSLQYVQIKGRRAEELGLAFQLAKYPELITEEELLQELVRLNSIENMSGLIVQLPLPSHLNRETIANAINPQLDVDCLGTTNSERFYSNTPDALIPPTAGAILYILKSLGESIGFTNMKFLVIGQGELVGKPVTHLLKQAGAEVGTIDRPVDNLQEYTLKADVIITATGQPNLLIGDMVKEGVIVIDAGTSESGGGIVGDVNRESVEPKAAFLSPVPGGVGPVTVAKLLENVIMQAKKHKS